MARSHYNWYLRRIKKRFPLARTFLESGLVVEIRYTPEYSGKTKNYLCLILHKGAPKGRLTPKRKIHLLSLENLPPKYFEELVDHVGLEYSRYFKQVRKLKLEKMLMEQRDAKRFYIKELKPYLETKFNATYRTFNIGNASIMKVIDFDWPGSEDAKIQETALEELKKHPLPGSRDNLREKFDDTGLKED